MQATTNVRLAMLAAVPARVVSPTTAGIDRDPGGGGGLVRGVVSPTTAGIDRDPEEGFS